MINSYFLKFTSKNFHPDNPTKKVKLDINIKLINYINLYRLWKLLFLD